MRKVVAVFLSVTLQLLLYTGCVSTDTSAGGFRQDSAGKISQPSKLAAGETIEISVEVDARMEVLSHTAQVSPEGMVTLPLIGDVKVGGSSLTQARTIITKEYSAYYVNPPVIMISLLVGPEGEGEWGSVTVMGQVDEPGRVPIRSREGINLTEAIQLAGGLSSSARTSDIRITRTDELGLKTQIKVDFNEIGQKGNADADIMLIDGDIVFVPQRIF